MNQISLFSLNESFLQWYENIFFNILIQIKEKYYLRAEDLLLKQTVVRRLFGKV